MSRKRLPEPQRRVERCVILLRSSERKRLERQARDRGVSVSQYVRDAVLHDRSEGDAVEVAG